MKHDKESWDLLKKDANALYGELCNKCKLKTMVYLGNPTKMAKGLCPKCKVIYQKFRDKWAEYEKPNKFKG